MRCRVCGEPWDLDTLHDETAERIADEIYRVKRIGTYSSGNPRYDQGQYADAFGAVLADFKERGCAVFKWACHNKPIDKAHQEMVETAFDLLGDDVDAIDELTEELFGEEAEGRW